MGQFYLIARCLQIAIATGLLLLVSPVVLFAIAMIKIDTGKSAIFKQIRIGKGFKRFTIYKLRTMVFDRNEDENQLSLDKEKYITRTGRMLRILKIDEIPQLLNVLKGDMNFIGPRPFRERLHRHYLERIPHFGSRYVILPGITGLAQVIDPLSKDRSMSLACDLLYIEQRNFKLNVSIIFYTLVHLLRSSFEHIHSKIIERWLQRLEPRSPILETENHLYTASELLGKN